MVLALYTFAGFLIAPYIVKNQAVSILSDTLQRPVAIEKVRINPYALSATVEGFQLTEADGANIARFDRLYVNFQLSSLFNRAWTFDEVTLEQPDVALIRDNAGAINLLKLAPKSESEPADTESTAIPPLLFHTLKLMGGQLHFTDQTRQPAYSTTLTPVNLYLTQLGTRVGDSGLHHIELSGESGIQLTVEGSLSVNPLDINGKVQASGPYLPVAYGYLRDMLNIQVDKGNLDLKLSFSVADSTKGYQAQLTTDAFNITNLLITDKETRTQMLALNSISLNKLHFAWPDKNLNAERLALARGSLALVREQNGLFNWQQVVASTASDEKAGITAKAAEEPANAVTQPAAENSETLASKNIAEAVNEQDIIGTGTSTSAIALAVAPVSESVENEAELTESPEVGATDELNISAESVPSGNTSDPAENASGLTVLPDWRISLSRADIAGFDVTYNDQTLKTPANIAIENITIGLENFSNQPDSVFPANVNAQLAETGALAFQGELTLIPDWNVQGDLTISTLPLTAFNPYIGNYLNAGLGDGTLSVTAGIASNASEPLALTANINVEKLDFQATGQTATDSQSLLNWQALNIENLVLTTSPLALRSHRVALEEPYLRFRIYEDQSTNFHQLMDDSPTPDETRPISEAKGTVATNETADTEKADNAPMALSIDEITINNATVDFADYALPIPFDNTLSKLNGQLSHLSTVKKVPGELDIKGQVGEYGLAKISGKLSPWDFTEATEVKVKLQNVDMPDLKPYSIKFVGREIDNGRMNLDLDYKLNNGKVKGTNDLVLTKFELGKKVPHEGALSLPLDLAVALLKGPEGNIDINLPVNGDINDPSFSIGGIILKVFANLITKAVTAPFKLLGALVGASDDNFDKIYFEPGFSDISPPELEKLHQLTEAMKQRPQLGLKISGVFDPKTDVAAIKEQKLDELIEKTRQEKYGEKSEPPRAEQRLKTMEALFTQFVSEDALASLKEKHPPSEEGILPDTYWADIRAGLLNTIAVEEETLTQLANLRAENIASALTDEDRMSPERVSVVDPQPLEKSRKEGIALKLEVWNLK